MAAEMYLFVLLIHPAERERAMNLQSCLNLRVRYIVVYNRNPRVGQVALHDLATLLHHRSTDQSRLLK